MSPEQLPRRDLTPERQLPRFRCRLQQLLSPPVPVKAKREHSQPGSLPVRQVEHFAAFNVEAKAAPHINLQQPNGVLENIAEVQHYAMSTCYINIGLQKT